LVLRHPSLSLAFASANEQRGTTARVAGRDVAFVATEDASLSSAELVFSALPHGASKEWVGRIREAGVRAIDLSADLRPGNGCEGIAYGMTELNRASVSGAELVANPGCYPTSILVALAPLFERGLVADGATVIANSASGVSGAGHSPKRELLFGEIAENFRAYGVGNTHRHLNEMSATLEAWGANADLVFTPHLLPVARGILSTITVPLSRPIDDVLAPWRESYAGEPFIEITNDSPRFAWSTETSCALAPPIATRRRCCSSSAIDNLLKGAPVRPQNANLMLGLDETAGLPA
jgi:N-acetyl-gamma-glutamyl-phosphate reductase